MSQIWLAFLTGLTTGGISCFAVQGGLLTSSLAHQEKGDEQKAITVFLFLKLIAYTLLGGFLGFVGSSFAVSPTLQGYLQTLAGFFMILTVGRILDIHPVFRKLVITPPKFLFRIVRKKSLDPGVFSAGVLGAFTVLIPCGVTQAMMLLATSSQSPVLGSLILAAFTLGTSPVFFALGIASDKILHIRSLKLVAALVIFYLGVLAVNTGQILRGSPHNLQNYYLAATGKLDRGEYSQTQVAQLLPDGSQRAEIKVSTYGYASDIQTIRVGVPTILTLTTNGTRGCSRAFTIPEYGISKILPETGSEIITFTPTKTGRLAYTCSMGMYTGLFNVIN